MEDATICERLGISSFFLVGGLNHYHNAYGAWISNEVVGEEWGVCKDHNRMLSLPSMISKNVEFAGFF